MSASAASDLRDNTATDRTNRVQSSPVMEHSSCGLHLQHKMDDVSDGALSTDKLSPEHNSPQNNIKSDQFPKEPTSDESLPEDKELQSNGRSDHSINGPSTDELSPESKDDVMGDDKDDEKKEMIEEEKKEPLHPGLPVDRGWAWVIMIASFLVTFLMMGYARALSMFFLEFIQLFEVSVTMATIALGIMTACFGVGNVVVSNALLSHFEARTIVLSGTIIASIFVALSALAPNMIFIIVTHCFIGFSHALMYVPTVTLLGHYFDTRRSFAMSVANCGVSVSALIFPPLTQHLITSFGARGALLLVSGLQMQAVVAASLLRPVSYYVRKKRTAEKLKEEEAVKDREEGVIAEKVVNKTNAAERQNKESEANLHDAKTAVRLLDDFERHETEANVQWKRSADMDIEHLLLSSSVPEKSFFPLSPEPERFSSLETLNVSRSHVNGVTNRKSYSRQQSCPSHPMNSTGGHVHKLTSQPLTRTSVCTTSMVDVCGSAANISVTVLPLTDLPAEEDSEGENEEMDNKGCCRRFASAVLAIFDLSLFKSWLFRLIATYAPLGLMAGFIGFYFPSLGVGQGLPRPQAALLLTVVGGVDLGSRLLFGYLADLNKLKRTHLVIFCMTVLGVASMFCRFYTNFALLAMFGVIYGLFGGTCQNLFAVVVIDLLGLPRLGKVMGLVLLLNASWASLMHPVIGALVDLSGSFVVPINFVGGGLLLSSCVLLLEPCARRLENQRLEQLATQGNKGGWGD